ncbi:MAG: hypothetical protein LBS63_05480 [Prevotellaceae bacterium]|jgi:hypothetical protein|nr:hypothetical protein [Prevotellaceae bacterium]
MNYSVHTQPALNPTQLHLVEMFSFTKHEENLAELKVILLDFYRKKVDTETEAFWTSHHLDNAKMEGIMYAHNRRQQ